ncbi:MAG: D-alanyl-D-alanine carboxypeptidase [Ruminococcaceae bacterium]|nr:D-alanyl-D-alanine carboxypeptidase [Oscillospiraceae bacterium]
MKTCFLKRCVCLFLAAFLLFTGTLAVGASYDTVPIAEGLPAVNDGESSELPCRAAILMDAATGRVLFEQNADEALPPASVTKVMTLLLVMEAVDSGVISLSDEVTVSAHAASMGGSQVYLKEGETMSVEEMIKCVVIASANDCAVALAEHVAGSEEEFVARMNARAAELSMNNTHFENTNGLDDTVEHHLISARDIAIMSRELISHPKILEYSGIWMDTIRDGTFGLTNTNRLVRFYQGCTGLKTGSTAKAKFCISATAERDGLSLICVIMAAESRDVRNATATKLLDYGFANYSAYRAEAGERRLAVTGGTEASLLLRYDPFFAVVKKGSTSRVEAVVEMPESAAAPIEAGEELGRVHYLVDGEEIGSVPLIAEAAVPKMNFSTLFVRILKRFLLI